MKYHMNKQGIWLECRAWRGKCPFGAGADKSIPEIIEQAATSHKQGNPTPILKDTAGNTRDFEFEEDGSYTFGARAYDRHGVLIPSDRTVKSWRLKEDHIADEVEDFDEIPVEGKLQFMGPALMRHELSKGVLAGQEGAGIRFTHFQDYTRKHHRGLFGLFFKSEWELTSGTQSVGKRYRRTLEGMFGKVRGWLFGKSEDAA